MIISIIEVRYLEQYKIWLRFNTGEEGIVDLTDVITRYPAIQALKDISKFAKFYLDEWPTLAWPCGFDYSPESLYRKICSSGL